MNNQLQLPWVQPCEEITPISKPWSMVALQKKIKKITCHINKLDQFANSLSSSYTSSDSFAQKVISRNVLR